LSEKEVEFVVVGGLAAVAHGASRMTRDVDICCPMTEANFERLVEALRDLHAHFRDHRERALPEARELAGYQNLYLETDWGELDVLGKIAGVGDHQSVKARSIEVSLWGQPVRVLALDALIEGKRALGREKDRDAVLELELIRAKIKEP